MLTRFYVGFWQKLPKFLARNFSTEVYRFGVTIPIISIGYPDEQPDAKPRDASKVKYIK